MKKRDANEKSLSMTRLTSQKDDAQIVQRSVAQLPWAHNVVLLQKVKDIPIRLLKRRCLGACESWILGKIN